MKKWIAIMMTGILLLGCTACSSETGGAGTGNDVVSGNTGASTGNDAASESSVDMSNYPESLDDWTGQNFVDYFKEVGVFTDDGDYETWVQDHATYWPETPVDECAGWWNEDGTVMVMIFVMSGENADTSEDQLNEWKNSVLDSNTFPGEYATVPVDHIVGNVAFSFETTVTDEDVYNAFKSAYQELLDTMGVTPEI